MICKMDDIDRFGDVPKQYRRDTSQMLAPPTQYLATLLRDLNLFVFHINSFYKRVHADYLLHFDDDKPPKNWMQLLATARSDTKVHLRVLDLAKSHGLNPQDFDNLLYLRKTRNSLCHPRLHITSCQLLAEQNWSQHRCFRSLLKLFVALENTDAISDALPRNWRNESSPTKKVAQQRQKKYNQDQKSSKTIRNLDACTTVAKYQCNGVIAQSGNRRLYSDVLELTLENKVCKSKCGGSKEHSTKHVNQNIINHCDQR